MKTLRLSWRLSMGLMACMMGYLNAQTITISTLTPNSVSCGSNSFLSFTKTGVFNAGNTFDVQLSDASGSFANPRTMGNGGASPINYTGLYVAPGSYSIRIVSSNPVVTSNVIGPYTVLPSNVLTGSSFNVPIDAGKITCGSPFSSTLTNSACYGDDYDIALNSSHSEGQVSNDIYYKFTLERTESIDISTCSSGSLDTYVHLLDQYGNHIISCDDNGIHCSGVTGSLTVNLSKGTYYVVSETFTSYIGSITTQISARDGLYFDGVDDRLSLDSYSATLFNFGTGPFTFEANIQATKTGLGTIFGKRGANGYEGFCFGEGGNGKLWMQLAGANYEAPTTTLGTGCRHVAVTRDVNDTLRFYVDGTLIWKIRCANNINSSTPAFIGWDPYYPQYFKGYIRDLRMWNYERTQTQLVSYRNVRLSGTEIGLFGNYQLIKEFNSPYQYISHYAYYGGSLATLGTTTSVESSDPTWSCQSPCNLAPRPDVNDEDTEVTGITQEEAEGELKVYPNPFVNATTILLTGKQETVRLEIVNMNGTVVYRNDAYKTNEKLIIGDLFATGFYILRVKGSEGTKILKLVKAQ